MQVETQGNALKLVDQLDRKDYVRTNKVIEAAGGVWSRAAKAHLFEGEAADRLDQILLTGEIIVPKDEFNVLHALKFLKPGGLLTSVMSAGVGFRNNKNKLTTDFQALVDARGGEIEPLPAGAFKASGTMVSTVIVSIPF